MKTITVTVDSKDVARFGLEQTTKMKFGELVDKINRDFARQALKNAQSVAKQTGLSDLSQEEIDQEIKAIRNESHP
jgi:Glu-tRNA(Gln) amidotransferase subunit E-like FAD-binding protein